MVGTGDSPKQTDPAPTPQPNAAGSRATDTQTPTTAQVNPAITQGSSATTTQTSAATQNTTSNQVTKPNDKMVFNSAEIGTKTARKQDVFAEHKRKDAEKKAKNKMTRKKVLIFGGLGLVLVVGIVILVTFLIKNNSAIDGNNPEVIEENQKLLDDITNEAQAKLKIVENEETGEEEEDDSEVIEVYQNAINNARNKNSANVARLALMQHYLDNGDESNAAKVGGEIGNPDEMDLASRYAYYDTMAQAYYELSEYDLAEYYEEKVANLATEYMNFVLNQQGGE